MTKVQINADLSDPATFDNGLPQQAFAQLRALDGLAWNLFPEDGTEAGFWSVGKFDDIVTVSRNPELFSSYEKQIQMYNVEEDARAERSSMIDLDPPNHTRLRRLVNPSFMPRILRDQTETIRARVARLLDDMLATGGGDWVEKVAKPIPIGVVCDMLGVPAQDHQLMIEMTDHLVAGTSADPLPENAYGNTTPLRFLAFNSPAAFGMAEYSRKLCDLRRADPKDDLVTLFATEKVEGAYLTERECTNFFQLMVFAGNETTRGAMAHLALLMAQHPKQFARLKNDPSLIPNAVEEVVRYASPILYFRRTAMQDTELSGTKIAKGDRIVLWYASGNFDETRFDDPQKFDVGRAKLPVHAGYGGGGVHLCLGANLARIELTVLIEEILKRDIKIELDSPPQYVSSNFVNGIEKLMVKITQEA